MLCYNKIKFFWGISILWLKQLCKRCAQDSKIVVTMQQLQLFNIIRWGEKKTHGTINNTTYKLSTILGRRGKQVWIVHHKFMPQLAAVDNCKHYFFFFKESVLKQKKIICDDKFWSGLRNNFHTHSYSLVFFIEFCILWNVLNSWHQFFMSKFLCTPSAFGKTLYQNLFQFLNLEWKKIH